MAQMDVDLNQTIMDKEDAVAPGQPPPSASGAADVQLQMFTKMMNKMDELATDIRAISQRVSNIEKPHTTTAPNQHQAASNDRPPRPGPTGMTAATDSPANAPLNSATLWNGPTELQVSNLNPLAQRPFELPIFSGKPAQWPMFLSAYRQSTAAFGYTPLQNMFRLQKCLDGKAREAVESLLMDPKNVEKLIDTLELRFGRPDLLYRDQIEKLREYPQITERQYEQLIAFSSYVSNAVAFLDTNASRHVLSEASLLNDMLVKLPQTRIYEWLQYTETINTRPTVNEFSEWLGTVARRVSRSPVMLTTGNIQRQSYDRRVLINVSEQCSVCESSHKVSECDKFRRLSMEERWTTARRYRLCFGCLHTGHPFMNCHHRRGAGYHELLCERNEQQRAHAQPRNRNTEDEQTQHNENHNAGEGRNATRTNSNATSGTSNPFSRTTMPSPVLTCHDDSDFPLLFRVIPVALHGPTQSTRTFALLDEGSSVTLIDKNLANELGLDGPTREISLNWFENHSTTSSTKAVKLKISSTMQNCEKYDMKNVFTVSNLNLPTQSIEISPNDPRHAHLRNLPIVEYRHGVPKILIGLDHSHLGAALQTETGQCDGPIAAKTRLGWVVYGRQGAGLGGYIFHCSESIKCCTTLEKMIQEFHSTEGFGVMAPGRALESDEHTRARELLETTTKRVGDRYQTGLLWRSDDVRLPDSFPMALQRYTTIARKMQRDVEYAQLYARQIEDYVSKGYARRLTMEEASVKDDRTWYLPHFGVQTIHKPGKLRIVFDAAATVSGVSLNSTLLKGPDLNQPLFDILMQFRMRRIGVTADISEMFHQIVIQPADRRSQRFLWRSDGGNPPDVYEMVVMTFGASCSPTSAQFIKNLNATGCQNIFPEAADAVRKLHYVDDFVASFATEDDATRITKQVVEIHSRGGFVLRGFVSNSQAVLHNLGVAVNTDNEVIDMQLDSAACDKILGLRWQTRNDTFVFCLKFINFKSDLFTGERAPTKREILSAMMSIFDPFGFLADVMLHTKMMVQELWRLQVTWDVPVPEVIHERWIAWCKALKEVERFNIPRCYSPFLLESTNVQLHCFADASEEAFAAVCYFRILHGNEYTVAFIAGKTRCAPLKQLSVPRLELQAAVLATRLYSTIRNIHNINIAQIVFWTDSRTVLQWLCSTERRFRPFVAHRVAEVLETTRASDWRWLPTKENVADDATRCRTPPTFNADSRWIRGPAFLRLTENQWPLKPTVEAVTEELPEEIRHRFANVVVSGNKFDFSRFSSFYRLTRAVGWALRFKNNSQSRKIGIERCSGELTTDEVQFAIMILCRIVQAEGFPDEYKALSENKPIPKSSPIHVLMPYIDDEKTMRLYGRTDSADPAFLPVSAQRPILLPHKHLFTELIVLAHHSRMSHQFEGSTICSVRRQYWVPNLRSLVRKVRRNCQACKIRSARPKPPVAGQLPIDRMMPYTTPFSYTGVDYFGPVHVTIGRRKEKRWICMFTCLTIRAVHMEIAENLSTDACLVCLRNFCNIRGVPVRLRSDCGTNFVGADHELKKMGDIFDCDDVKQEMCMRGIQWVFNCPANPEAGGAWERLIQSTKRVLSVTLKEVAPRVETLRSLIIEAANILNSRPLTDIPVSPNDHAPLTPNHFLIGRMNATTTTDEFVPRQLCHRKQFRILTQLKNHFWARWVTEYLPELTRRKQRGIEDQTVKLGDLVLICDANQTRGQWLRGRIERVMLGTDGRVRVAEVRTKDGLLKRPVSKLAVLDVEDGKSAGADLRGPGCRRASS